MLLLLLLLFYSCVFIENLNYFLNVNFDIYVGNNSDRAKFTGSKEITASADDLFNNSENLFSNNNEGYAYNNKKIIPKGNETSRKNSYQLIESNIF